MLLRQETLRGIQSGAITLAFRRWKRPTVKTGGTLLTPIGQLAIEGVDVVSLKKITKSEAARAGFSTLAALREQLMTRTSGDIYRIRFSLAGADPRIALRKKIPKAGEMEKLVQRLAGWDARSVSGEWVLELLELIQTRPSERAGNLAETFGEEKASFKARVRKLKGLGLAESLSVGYQVSPRGKAVLRVMQSRKTDSG